MFQPKSDISTKKPFCYMQMKARPCIKERVGEAYRKDYRCDQCLWRIHSDAPEHLTRMEKLFSRYHTIKP